MLKFRLTPLFPLMLKLTSLLAAVLGIVLAGSSLYVWAQVMVIYNAFTSFLTLSLSQLGANGVAFDPLPLWPVLVADVAIMWLAALVFVGLWTAAEMFELQVTMIEEDRQHRELELKAWKTIAGGINTLTQR